MSQILQNRVTQLHLEMSRLVVLPMAFIAAIRSSLVSHILSKPPNLPRSAFTLGHFHNGIGRLRADLPRNTNLDTCTPRDIQDIIQNYNDTPRKCLDFQTPYEAFVSKLKTVALGM